MNCRIEFEREGDDRWLAEIADLPGVLAYGATREEAEAAVEALALRVIADRIEAEKVGQKQLVLLQCEQVAEFESSPSV